MKTQKLDALVATSHDSVFYLTKAYKIPARSIPTRLSAVVIPASGQPVLVACAITEALVEKSSKVRGAVFYREYIDSPIELVANVIRSYGLMSGRIGLEKIALSARFYDELRDCLPDAEFVAADQITDWVRMVKTPEEIRLLHSSALATDRAIRQAFMTAKPGEMEKNVESRIAVELLRNGADLVEHVTCGAGENAALAHPKAEIRPLENGELIRTDAGGIFSGYMSDLARTVVVGEPTGEQREYWEILYHIQAQIIAAARPGIRGRELHNLCLELFEQHRLIYAYTITGHGLGLGQHDTPIIGPDSDIALEENMVINLEPAHRNLGAIMHIEDTVLVTAEGGRILSRSADWSSLKLS
ncbi:Xaa-Pro peptidase family protein [Oscillibacter sp. MSJ-2]|uniref:Xaa-Pro peptidase family protein n=2 Tax=Dysosmobacter acutus TaxID=2841504 RepID=A0ABS6F6S5_9FIRM|nr:Xaa-Pro peptidase family protein [Dysosmobacter acutus]